MSELTDQIRILCVDDERNILQALERSFLDDNYEIVNAGSGTEGLQALKEAGPFQVVISDYRMPVMNGVEFLKKVYAGWPDTVRLVLSGYADVGAIVAAINEGHIYKFIPKPWDDQDLRLTIQKSLEHYLLQKKNRELQAELEFSENLLANLPAGVAGIDEQGLVVYCNDRGRKLLAGDSCNTTAADAAGVAAESLGSFVEEVRRKRTVSAEIVLGGRLCTVRGRLMSCDGKEIVILVVLEAVA
ncbi:MAG: response regulator [Geobacteraceae bacterium]|nr:response regulator [Geobacteraceae bacterium]